MKSKEEYSKLSTAGIRTGKSPMGAAFENLESLLPAVGEVVFYTLSRRPQSVRAALRLKRHGGITHLHAQLGGFSAWRELGLLRPKFPVSVYCFATKAQLLHVFDVPQRCPQSPPLFPASGKSKDCWKPAQLNAREIAPQGDPATLSRAVRVE